MFDRSKCLESFYELLDSLLTEEEQKVLELYLRNGKKFSLKIEVIDNKIEPVSRRLLLIKHDLSQE